MSLLPRPKLGLTAKYFLAIFSACLLVLVINGAATRLNFQQGFMDYLNDQGEARLQHLLPHLVNEYRQNGGWEHLRTTPRLWRQLLHLELVDGHGQQVQKVGDPTGVLARVGLFDSAHHLVAGNPDADDDSPSAPAMLIPVKVDDVVVGWLGMVPFNAVVAANDVEFYNAQLRAWWLTAGVALLITATFAWLVSRALRQRLAKLADATHQLAAGDYAIRIQPTANDELDALANDFNQMAQALANVEQNRRRFMADISHELRTPLAVVRAELEAMEDGIRPLDRGNLGPLQQEVRQIGKLIDDLHDLSMTQSGGLAYRFAALDLVALLASEANRMRARFDAAGLKLQLITDDASLLVQGDEWRLQQLLANLLENTLRYTAPGGLVNLHAWRAGSHAMLMLEDSAPGVSVEQCDRLFERFYRVEASRNRASGGSGLGLAICHNIVLAHQGRIRAEPSPLGGLRIVIRLPVSA